MLVLITEYADGGTLRKTIKNLERPFPWYLRISITRDIAAGMVREIKREERWTERGEEREEVERWRERGEGEGGEGWRKGRRGEGGVGWRERMEGKEGGKGGNGGECMCT